MSQLAYSMFYEVLLAAAEVQDNPKNFSLQKICTFSPHPKERVSQQPLIVFDFETTGLDTVRDYVIEIGALRTVNGEVTGEFSTLIKPPVKLDKEIIKITGITDAMLVDQPPIEAVLADFLDFIDGAILVAHNADFDHAFLRTICKRQGIDIRWPAFCTLKLARQLLPHLESKSLDGLAAHYGLSFEARHRSIGDCKVTHSVLQAMLGTATDLNIWQDFEPYFAR